MKQINAGTVTSVTADLLFHKSQDFKNFHAPSQGVEVTNSTKD